MSLLIHLLAQQGYQACKCLWIMLGYLLLRSKIARVRPHESFSKLLHRNPLILLIQRYRFSPNSSFYFLSNTYYI